MDTQNSEAQKARADSPPLEKGGVAGVDSKEGKLGEPPTKGRQVEKDAKIDPKAG